MHENKISRFNSIYINPGFEEIPELLDKQNNGFRTMILFETDLERTDYFQHTRFFPFTFFELPKKIKEYKMWQSLFKMVPHLFHAQKVFYPNISGCSKFVAHVADLKFNNSFQKKHEWISAKQKSLLPFLKSNFKKGIFFQEYRFNYSRFFIETLKYFRALGGVVEINKKIEINGNELIFLRSQKKLTADKIIIRNKQSNQIIIFKANIPPGFAMAIKQNRNFVYFSEDKNKMIVQSPVNISETALFNMAKNNINIGHKEYQTGTIPKNISTQLLHKITSQVKNPISCSFEKTIYQNIHELSLEKYDIAKQTGISYTDFKVLFHRYGKGIDEMTENAYHQMNRIRDSKIIWTSAAEMFQKEYEWKI